MPPYSDIVLMSAPEPFFKSKKNTVLPSSLKWAIPSIFSVVLEKCTSVTSAPTAYLSSCFFVSDRSRLTTPECSGSFFNAPFSISVNVSAAFVSAAVILCVAHLPFKAFSLPNTLFSVYEYTALCSSSVKPYFLA